jgi:hypothetical protein
MLPLFMSAWQNESSQTFFFIRFMRVSCRSRPAGPPKQEAHNA